MVTLIYPILAMVLWTLVVGLIMLVARIQAVRAGTVSVGYFVLVQGDNVPTRLQQLGNNFNNLFALPVLFYVLCLLLLMLNVVNPYTVGLAWAFVVSRVVHSLIHITYNHVLHRMLAFLLGFVLLLALLAQLGLAVL